MACNSRNQWRYYFYFAYGCAKLHFWFCLPNDERRNYRNNSYFLSYFSQSPSKEKPNYGSNPCTSRSFYCRTFQYCLQRFFKRRFRCRKFLIILGTSNCWILTANIVTLYQWIFLCIWRKDPIKVSPWTSWSRWIRRNVWIGNRVHLAVNLHIYSLWSWSRSLCFHLWGNAILGETWGVFFIDFP